VNKDRSTQGSFSETEAQQILARAAELEGTEGARFTAEDLRQIAATADIDPRALERAMKEAAGVPVRSVSPGEVPMNAGQLAVLAGAGIVLGATAVMADNMSLGAGSAVAIFAPSALFTIYRAIRHPLRDGIGALLRELGIVFGSFTLAIVASQGFDAVSPAMAWSLVCGALGTAVLAMRGGVRVINPGAGEGALIDGR
jgi:hypothetical protein